MGGDQEWIVKPSQVLYQGFQFAIDNGIQDQDQYSKSASHYIEHTGWRGGDNIQPFSRTVPCCRFRGFQILTHHYQQQYHHHYQQQCHHYHEQCHHWDPTVAS